MASVTANELLERASQYEAAGNPEEALKLYNQVLRAVPDHFELLMKVASLSEKHFFPTQSISAYQKAVKINPKSFHAAAGLSRVLWEDDSVQSVAVLEKFVEKIDSAEQKTQCLADLVRLREWSKRQGAGLPIHHLLDFSEFPFRYAKQGLNDLEETATSWVASEPTNSEAHVYAGHARQALGDYRGANAAYKLAGKLNPDAHVSNIRLGEPALSPLTLPSIIGEYPTDPCVFLACDVRYLNLFVIPLLKSLKLFSPAQRVHVHLMENGGDIAAALDALKPLPISVTQEDPADFLERHKIRPEYYFGAARFIRFAEALDINSGPLWMADVDSLVRNDPQQLLNIDGDVAIRVRAGRIEPWNQFSACLIMGRSSARPYFRHVANIVAQNISKAWWGLDQYALFSAYLVLKERGEVPNFTWLGPSQADVEWRDDGVFWFTAGGGKARLFANPKPSTPSRFETLFARYR